MIPDDDKKILHILWAIKDLMKGLPTPQYIDYTNFDIVINDLIDDVIFSIGKEEVEEFKIQSGFQ